MTDEEIRTIVGQVLAARGVAHTPARASAAIPHASFVRLQMVVPDRARQPVHHRACRCLQQLWLLRLSRPLTELQIADCRLQIWNLENFAICNLQSENLQLTMSSVLITRRLPGTSVARLAAHHEVDLHAGELPLSTEELHERLEGKAGVVVLLGERIDSAAIDAAGPSLKIIANVAVGYDNLDVAYAVSKGIVCTNTPDVLTDATADLTWALILGLTRRLGEGERLLRAGAWKGWGFDFMLGSSLSGKLMGIVGGGRIGRAVATRAAAFGMRVAVSSRRDPQWPGVEFMGFDRLISNADVISLHVPLTTETRHLIDRKTLTRMKRSAYLHQHDTWPGGRRGGVGMGVG